MSAHRRRTAVVLGATVAVFATIMFAAAYANAASDKLAFTGQFGSQVNAATLGDLCTVESGDTCQNGLLSEASGGFDAPASVAPGLLAKGEAGVYVADDGNARVQEFSAAGVFVGMFGWNVDKTKVELGGAVTQAEKNVCTAVSKDTCQKGEKGGLAGQMATPESVAVDQATKEVYVLDYNNNRVEQYTPEGTFVRMIGGEVNETAHLNHETANENVCPVKAGDTCKAGVGSTPENTVHGAFKTDISRGDLLAIGGPEDRLYVGGEGGIQEFNKATGEWVAEIKESPLSPTVAIKAFAVDPSGDVYVVSGQSNTVDKFSSTSAPTEIKTSDEEIGALAVDPFGRIAVHGAGSATGSLYSATGRLLGQFGPPGGFSFVWGMTFNSNGELYVPSANNQDVEIYAPTPVAELTTGSCKSQTATGVTLTGEVNPKGLSGEEARVWFQYGRSEALGSDTPGKDVGTGSVFVPVEVALGSLRPNETYYYRLVGEDEKARAPEPPLVAETIASCATPPLAPVVSSEPSAFDTTFSTVVLAGSVNPENASTEYFFEYAPGETLKECAGVKLAPSGCPGVQVTPVLVSSQYGVRGTAQSVGDLIPGTPYRYRLFAENEHKEAKSSGEGSFTTTPEPAPWASTGPASTVGVTTATLTGAVDADGAGATYLFQIGVYNGTSTAYGTILSAAAGAQTEAELESFALGGLQPGTTYAYRIALSSAYVANETHTTYGEPVLFTTAGLPSVLFAPSVLGQLPVPQVAFPKPLTSTKVKPKHKTKKPKTKAKHKKKGRRSSRRATRTATGRK
jgi:hypothetical protein